MKTTEEAFRVEKKLHTATGDQRFLCYLNDKLVPHVPITGKLVHRLSGFAMIHKDLSNVLAWLNEAERLLKTAEFRVGGTFVRLTDRGLGNRIKSLFVSSIVFYGKAFSQAAGRNATMNKQMLDAAHHDSHDEMMKYRHNFVAHSGSEKLEHGESCIMLWPLDDDSFGLRLHTNRTQPDFVILDGDCERFASLVEHVMAKADAHYEKLATQITERASKLGATYWMTAYGRSKTIDMDNLPKQ